MWVQRPLRVDGSNETRLLDIMSFQEDTLLGTSRLNHGGARSWPKGMQLKCRLLGQVKPLSVDSSLIVLRFAIMLGFFVSGTADVPPLQGRVVSLNSVKTPEEWINVAIGSVILAAAFFAWRAYTRFTASMS